MLDSKVQSTQALIDAFFPGISDPGLPGCVEHLLSCVHIEHYAPTTGAVFQALLIANLNLVARKGDCLNGSRAILRLHLANGLLYELNLSGDVRSALRQLDRIGIWLSSQPYDVEQFDRYDAVLTELVNSRLDRTTSTVSLTRYAAVAPPPLIREHMMLKMAHAALNLLRKDYSLAPFDEVPLLLTEHVKSARARTDLAIRTYLNNLNQSVLAVIHEYRNNYHHRYDDLKVYNFLAIGSGQHCRNRVQAIRELPWLLRILSGMDKMHSYDIGATPVSRQTPAPAITAIIHAIDTGKPLFGSIAEAFAVPKETVRWTRSRMLPPIGQFAVTRMDLLLAILSWLPPEKRPQTELEWNGMRVVFSALLPPFTALCNEAALADVLTTEPRVGAIMARWLRELACPTLCTASQRVERMRYAGDDPESVKDYVSALLRSLRRFCRDSVQQGNDSTDLCKQTLLEWLASQPFYRLMALSRRWHSSMQGYLINHEDAAPLMKEHEAVKWTPVLPRPMQLGALRIVELCDSKSLVEEGRTMNHCVGGYSLKCALENSLIVSLRTLDNRRLSTAELLIQEQPHHVSLTQHKGWKNMPAPQVCEATLVGLITLLNQKDYQPRLIKRREFQKTCRRKYDTAQEQLPHTAAFYRRVEEYNAWESAFGRAPDEMSVLLRSILLKHTNS